MQDPMEHVDSLARELLATLTIKEREFLADVLMPPTVRWASARDQLRSRLLHGFSEASYTEDYRHDRR